MTGGTIIPTQLAPTISSLSPTSGPIGTSVTIYGSGFTSPSYVLIDGQVASAPIISPSNGNSVPFTVPSSASPQCNLFTSGQKCPQYVMVVSPGVHNISVITANGTSNSIGFTVSGGTTQPPVISGINGPQSLNVNQQGTWTVKASAPNGGNLSYSVIWGDEMEKNPAFNRLEQNATFTHSYSQAGIYNPSFTVTNRNGQSAQTSLSVNVGDSISTDRAQIIQPPFRTQSSITVGRLANFSFNAKDVDNDNF